MADYMERVKALRCQRIGCGDCPMQDMILIEADHTHHTYVQRCIAHEAADAIEELEKDLERSKEWESFWEKEANEALKKFQVAVANKPRWIPVSERLPEKCGEYIVYLHPFTVGTPDDDVDDWGYTTAMYFDKGQSLWTYNETSYNAVLSAVDTGTEYHITHWMPLPAPPKEET